MPERAMQPETPKALFVAVIREGTTVLATVIHENQDTCVTNAKRQLSAILDETESAQEDEEILLGTLTHKVGPPRPYTVSPLK